MRDFTDAARDRVRDEVPVSGAATGRRESQSNPSNPSPWKASFIEASAYPRQ